MTNPDGLIISQIRDITKQSGCKLVYCMNLLKNKGLVTMKMYFDKTRRRTVKMIRLKGGDEI